MDTTSWYIAMVLLEHLFRPFLIVSLAYGWVARHGRIFFLEVESVSGFVFSEVMVMGIRSSLFLQAVTRYISSGLKRDVTDPTVTELPDFIENLTSEQRMAVMLFRELLVREFKAKQQRVIVRSLGVIAILAGVVIADPSALKVVAEALKEILVMLLVEGQVPGQE